jgi:hypothetical protein
MILRRRASWWSIPLSALVCLALGACGGGSGNSATSSGPATNAGASSTSSTTTTTTRQFPGGLAATFTMMDSDCSGTGEPCIGQPPNNAGSQLALQACQTLQPGAVATTVPLGRYGLAANTNSAGAPLPVTAESAFTASNGDPSNAGLQCHYFYAPSVTVTPGSNALGGSFRLTIRSPGSQSQVCSSSSQQSGITCTQLQAGTAASLFVMNAYTAEANQILFSVSCPNGYNAQFNVENGGGGRLSDNDAQSMVSTVTPFLREVCARFAS